jgi:hypothetical protein
VNVEAPDETAAMGGIQGANEQADGDKAMTLKQAERPEGGPLIAALAAVTYSASELQRRPWRGLPLISLSRRLYRATLVPFAEPIRLLDSVHVVFDCLSRSGFPRGTEGMLLSEAQ